MRCLNPAGLVAATTLVAFAPTALAIVQGVSFPPQASVSLSINELKREGYRFLYIRALGSTPEGEMSYDQHFADLWIKAQTEEMPHGVYANLPSVRGNASVHATWLVAAGGSYRDNKTALPPALSLVPDNAYGQPASPDADSRLRVCYGMEPRDYRNYLREYLATFHSLTGFFPMIHTYKWIWEYCTGGWTGVAEHIVLWVVQDKDTLEIPFGWRSPLFIERHRTSERVMQQFAGTEQQFSDFLKTWSIRLGGRLISIGGPPLLIDAKVSKDASSPSPPLAATFKDQGPYDVAVFGGACRAVPDPRAPVNASAPDGACARPPAPVNDKL